MSFNKKTWLPDYDLTEKEMNDLEDRTEQGFNDLEDRTEKAISDVENKIKNIFNDNTFIHAFQTTQQSGQKDITLPFSVVANSHLERNTKVFIGVTVSPEFNSNGTLANYLDKNATSGFLVNNNTLRIRWEAGQNIVSGRHFFIYAIVKYI